MDTKPLVEAVERRAFAARTPLYKVAQRAGVSSAVFTRSRGGGQVSVGTLDALEKAIAEIEAERVA